MNNISDASPLEDVNIMVRAAVLFIALLQLGAAFGREDDRHMELRKRREALPQGGAVGGLLNAIPPLTGGGGGPFGGGSGSYGGPGGGLAGAGGGPFGGGGGATGPLTGLLGPVTGLLGGRRRRSSEGQQRVVYVAEGRRDGRVGRRK